LKRTTVLWCLLVILALPGCVTAFRHSPTDAAAKAEQMARALLINKDATSAHSLLDAASRARVTVSSLAQSAAMTPGYGKVTSIRATEYSPVDGQAAIDIYLVGTAGDVTYHYIVRMSGTADEGYLAAHMAGSLEDFTPNDARRKL
jgi:hypothetical protein